MKTIEVRGIECETANEAIQETNAGYQGGYAIHVGGKYLVVEKAEADRLAEMGVPFAYLGEHEMADGSFRIVTIPVNE